MDALTFSNFTSKVREGIFKNEDSPLLNGFSKIKSLFNDLPGLSSYKLGSSSDLLQSLLFGKEGNYKIFEIPVRFEKRPENLTEDSFLNSVYKIYAYIDKVLFFRNINIFIHEMGHALVFQAFGKKTQVSVYTNVTAGTAGLTSYHPSIFDKIISLFHQNKTLIFGFSLSQSQKNSIICVAGPICSALSCSLGMLFANLLHEYKLTPDWIRTTIKIISLRNLTNEIIYAIDSFIQNDKGDFGLIAKNGTLDLLLAGSSLTLASSLGFLGSEGWEFKFLLEEIISHLIWVKFFEFTNIST
ncbi:MAG: hypothetical protein JSS09_04190 [Verrucomicrobia bacterium]|nr:hypothetical protein [Verrucomicrobiota bacterium]